MTSPHIAFSALDIARALGQHPPTPEQQAVIEAPLQPLLVVAGAGSGKTETMAGRVVWLVANGLVRPGEVLGLTFTRKGAAELAERVGRRLRHLAHAGLLPESRDGDVLDLEETPTVSTYNAYAGGIVAEHGLRLGVEPDSRLLSEGAAWQLAHDVVASWDGDMSAITVKEGSVTAGLLGTAGELGEHLRSTADLSSYYEHVTAAVGLLPYGKGKRSPGPVISDLLGKAAAHRQILPLIDEYRRLKKERSALDFSDQIGIAAQLATRFPAIGAGERAKFRTVLLDEFQDTSEAQIVFLAALFAAGENRPGVTAVGDPNQSIFGWRGASAGTLEKFSRLFALPGTSATPVASLATSWRNDKAILRTANEVAGPLRAASVVPVAQLSPSPVAGEGQVEAARYTTEAEEAQAVAAWIAEHRTSSRADGTLPTAAVLCRRRAQFVPIMDALREAGIPAEAVGLGGLLLTPEVVDLVAMLWVVDDPGRGDHLMRLLTGPMMRLSPADIDGLGSWAQELSRRYAARAEEELGAPLPQRSQADLAEDSRDSLGIVEALADLPEPGWQGRDGEYLSEAARVRLAGFGRSLKRLRALAGLPLADFVGEAERVLGLDIEVLARPDYDPSTARAHLDAFAEVAATYSMQSDRPTLGGFLDWLDAAVEFERGLELPAIEVNTDAVQILTVHAAKGLEWDLVAVPGMYEGAFPSLGGTPAFADGEWRYKPHAIKGWVGGLTSIPYELRGDAPGLPVYNWQRATDRADLEEIFETFSSEGQRHAISEERRLAYVAFTRAKNRMLLSAPVWTATGAKPRVTSRFLEDVVAADLTTVLRWDEMPTPNADGELTNPLTEVPRVASWPTDPMQEARTWVEPGAELVRAQAQQQRAASGLPVQNILAVPGSAEDRDLEIELLLAERARERQKTRHDVRLPAHLSASDVVALAADPAEYARRLRRPLPSEPALAARRGTAFHAWVEQHYRSAALVDIDAMPGAFDEEPADEAELPELKANFLASEWANRTPVEVEVDVETVISGYAIRGRIDAVFARPEGGYTIVDWKTGRRPRGATLEHRSLQLASYAVAYARLRGVAEDDVDAAFFYAASGETYRPRLAGAEALEELLRKVTSSAALIDPSEEA